MKVEKVMINGKGYYHYRHCEKIMANLCMRCCFLKECEGGGHRCALPFKCEPDGYYIRYNEKPIEIGNKKIYVDVPPPPEPGEADKETGEKAASQQQLTERSEEKKESYVVINGVRYDAVKNEFERCFGCAFKHGLECSRNRADGFFVTCYAGFVFTCYSGFVFKCRGDVAAQQRLTERNEGRKPGIGKRSYYAFPNGVEAEDICRYLSFNLGNVVKYACRAGRKDAKKKIEDLMKARDYLDNEIKRLEEGEE